VLAFKIGRGLFVIDMSNTEFVIIGKILSADIDGEGSLHIILKNSNAYWAEYATKHLRGLTNQIIKADIKKWQQTTTTIINQTAEKTPHKPI